MSKFFDTEVEKLKKRIRSATSVVEKQSCDQSSLVKRDIVEREFERICKQYECCLSLGIHAQRFTLSFPLFVSEIESTNLAESFFNVLNTCGLCFVRLAEGECIFFTGKKYSFDDKKECKIQRYSGL